MAEEVRDEWDDGAATLLTYEGQEGEQVMLIRGPLVLLGWSLTNGGAASVKIVFYDGAAGIGPAVQINNGNTNNTTFFDSGIKIETELQVLQGANGPVTGCVFIRMPDYQRERRERSQSTQ